MLDFFSHLFDTGGFPPRWHCGVWTAGHGWLHIVSDLATFGAYLSIPLIIAYYVIRRQEVGFPRVFWFFGAFIFFCGLTHLIEASIFWQPWYRLLGVSKAATAIVSWMSVFALVGILPKALAVPSLAAQNSRLQEEIAARTKADELFRLATQSAPNGILMVDAKGTILLSNAALERIFGYSYEELRGESLAILLPDSVAETHPALFQEYLRQPAIRPMGANRDLVGIHRSGREVPVEIGLTPIQSEDGIKILAAVVDVTERQHLEQNLRGQRDDMEEVLYVVAHDMRSPLVTIQGFTSIALQKLADGHLEQAQANLARVTRAAGTLGSLTEGLLEFCQAERGERHCTIIDMDTLLEEVLNSLELKIAETKARVMIHKPLPALYADPTLMVQLFLNLIGNALKYGCPTPDSVVEVSGEQTQRNILFRVVDRGKGIPPHQRQRVFKLFQRLESQQAGAGLGLATVAKIMKRQRGKVWVEETEGGGATFVLKFPKSFNAPTHVAPAQHSVEESP